MGNDTSTIDIFRTEINNIEIKGEWETKTHLFYSVNTGTLMQSPEKEINDLSRKLFKIGLCIESMTIKRAYHNCSLCGQRLIK